MSHRCYAIGCKIACAPERLMCLRHWRMVPKDLQRQVWATYRPGQCDDKHPSEAWHAAADAAIAAVALKEGRELPPKLAKLIRSPDRRGAEAVAGCAAGGTPVEILI